jgi:hypothetical protein
LLLKQLKKSLNIFEIMSKKHSKILTDLHRLLETQDFKSIEEANEFLESIKDQPIPSFQNEAVTDKEIA